MQKLILSSLILGLCACSPVKTTVDDQYRLASFSHQAYVKKPLHHSILISTTDAAAGYQTEQMLYQNKPFELSAFTKHAWISSPASMIYPLILQSVQSSHLFNGITSGVYADKADYRLDTQLLEFQQDFLVKPSVIKLVMKSTLVDMENNQMIASAIFRENIPCPTDTPYGGVLAANQATEQLTAKISRFLLQFLQHH